MDVKENICRLCFNIVGNQCEIIDDTIREIFSILLIDLNLDICKGTVICGDCAKTTLRCLHFKFMCVHKEQQILSNMIKNHERKNPENANDIEKAVDDIDICTICTIEIKSDESKIGFPTIYLDMLPVFLPEKNIKLKKNLTICRSCREESDVYFNFIVNCVCLEGMITTYIRQSMKVVGIDLMDLQRWLLENGLDSRSNYIQTSHRNQHSTSKRDVKKSDLFPWELFSCATNYKNYKEVTEENAYKCQHCTYQTRRKNNFIAHQLVHKSASEVRRYKCLVCPFESKYTSAIKRHQLTHVDAVEMYKCVRCTFETKRKECLTIHNLMHKDASEMVYYKCAVCKYQTNRKGNLTQHLLVHKDASEVAIHKCTLCEFRTKYKLGLKTHMKTHTDVPHVEYKCETCEFVTKYKTSVKRHIKIHKRQIK